MSAPLPQIVFTNKAQCRDCYRCVRVCPVKAIRMSQGQAAVVPERCIACGTCVRECPQQAKSFRNDVGRVARLFEPGVQVAASVAPSFAAVFARWQWRRLPSALRRLGFGYVGETAIGAYEVAQRTAQLATAQAAGKNRPLICSTCPAVVRYVERYRSDLIDGLAPVVSPMLAHARHIRQKLSGPVRVVFIGPCVAKKAEAERPEHAGVVDAVLTFVELLEWLPREGIDLSACEESDFDEIAPGNARLFPLEGGCMLTGGLTHDHLDNDVLMTSGFDGVATVLEAAGAEDGPRVIEPLFCRQGCVGGPGMPGTRNVFLRRNDVLEYAGSRQTEGAAQPDPSLDLTAAFGGVPPEREVSEEEIRQALEATGKPRLADQLNCGACGYASCREKAVAVVGGMAEPQMCIPRMKRLAEQRVDRIIETSPNGIVMLDEQLRILHMNPAFRKFFMCSDAVCSQPIAYLMDPEPFERLAAGQENLVEATVEHSRYNLVCHQVMYPLREEQQYVGIFVNVTSSQANQQKLDRLRSQTVVQARELLEHQLQMAENLARFLGESTARGEDLVEKLVELADEEGETGNQRRGQWLRNMYTSK